MSVEVMSWVLRHSEAKLGQRLVLLSLADHANSDGTGAWPSVETISHEARLSRRQTQTCLRELIKSGAIVQSGTSPSGTRVYDVILGGADSAPPGAVNGDEGVRNPASGGADSAPEPSLVQPPKEQPPKAPTRVNVDGRNLPFDALAEEAGIVEDDPRTGEIVAALSGTQGIRALFWQECLRYVQQRAGNIEEAVELGYRLQALQRNEDGVFERALEQAIHSKAEKYRRAMDGALLTPGALRKWWVSVDRMQATAAGLTPEEIRRMGEVLS